MSNKSKYGNFIFHILISCIVILIYVFLGFLTLLGVKATASGLVPTDTNVFPYNNNDPKTIGEVISNIFILLKDGKYFSEKISFFNKNDPMQNRTNSLLTYIRNTRTSTSSHISMYFISIIESLLSLNYWIFSGAYDTLGFLPEFATVLLGPILIILLLFFLIILNYVYTAFLWFFEMRWFFSAINNTSKNVGKSKEEDSEDGVETGESKNSFAQNGLIYGSFLIFWHALFGYSKPKKEESSSGGSSSCSIILGIIYAIMFTILFFICLALGFGFLPVIMVHYSLISIISMKFTLNNNDEEKSSFGKFIMKCYRFFKGTVMGLISLMVISQSFSDLGSKQGIAAILVCFILFFIKSGTFKETEDKYSNFTPVLEKKQDGGFNNEEESFEIYNQVMNGGGRFVKELKNIGKKIPKK